MATVDTFYHLQACVDAGQPRQPRGYFPGSEAECQREGEAVDGILYVVVRGERYSEAPRGLSREIIICDFGTVPFLVNPADEEGGVRGLGRPSDAVCCFWYHRRYECVVGAIYHGVASGEQRGFLAGFLLDRCESAAVRAPYVGEYAYGGPYHVMQLLHLAGHRDSGLDDSYLRVGANPAER